MTTFTWAVDADGNWNDAANWSPQQSPTSGSDVVIDTADLHTIEFDSGTADVATLTVGNDAFLVSGGTFTLTGSATFGGSLGVGGGTLDLGASDVTAASFAQTMGTISGTGTLTVDGSAFFLDGGGSHVAYESGTGTTLLKGASQLTDLTLFLDGGRTLENQGAFTLTGAGKIYLGYNPDGANLGDATIQNDAGATFDIQTDDGYDGIVIGPGSGTTTVENAGTFEKTAGSGLSNIQVAFNNTGTLDVETGAIEFDAGGSSVGAGITVAFGAAIYFAGGTFTLGAGTAVSGYGLVDLTGGTLETGDNAVSLNYFTQEGGRVDGTDTLTINGPAIFATNGATHGTDYQTGTGTTLLEGDSSLGNVDLALDGDRTLENQGTFTITAGQIDLGFNPFGSDIGGGTIANDAGATFDIQTDDLAIGSGSGTTSVVNDGTFQKSAGTGISYVQAAFTNTGTVSVQTGTLRLTRGGSSTGSGITVASGAVLDFGGGTFTLGTGTAIGGSGLTELDGGTLETGADAVSVTAFKQDGGKIDGTGTLTINGAASFVNSNNYQTGTGTTLLKGTTTMSADLSLDGGRTLENQGTLTLTGGDFDLGYNPFGSDVGGGTFKNDSGATFDIKKDDLAVYAGSGTTTVVNAGTVKKSAGTGIAYVQATFNNTGTVSVQKGTLEFNGGGSSTGSGITVSSGAVLDFGGGTFTLGSGTAIGGAGLTEVNGGILETGANAVSVTAFKQDGGKIDGTGTLTINGAASFVNDGDYQTGTGTTLLKGTTTVSAGLAFDGGRTLENQGTLNVVTGGQVELGFNPIGNNIGGGTFKNDAGATVDLQADGLKVSGTTGTTAFVNAGTVKKSAGTGISYVQTTFNNSGTLSVQTGTLEFNRSGSSTGSGMTVSSGAVLDFGGGTFTLGTGTAIGGAGLTEVNGGILETGANAVSVTAFKQDGGKIDGTGTLTIKGAASFVNDGDYQTGTGTTLVKGTTTVSAGLAFDGGRTLENQGTLNVVTGGQVELGFNPIGNNIGGGTFKNDAGATVDLQADGLKVSGTTGTTAFVNAGTVKKSAGTGISYVQTTFNNSGTVSVQTGTLEFNRGGSSTGSGMTVSSGAVLDFGGGTFTLGSGTAIGGAGLTEVNGGILETGANAVSVTAFKQDGGKIDGTGTLTIKGAASFVNGNNYQTGTGTTLLKGTTNISANLSLDGGRTLENQGTLNLTGGSIFLGSNPVGNNIGGAEFGNDAGATFNILTDGAPFSIGTGTTFIANSGTFAKTGGTGTSNIETTFTSIGTVSAQSGTLQFDGTNSFGGTITGSTSVLLQGTSTFAGLAITGTVSVTNNTTVTQNGAVTIGGASFTNASGATYNLAGNVGIASGTGAGSSFTNAGTLAKTSGTGSSTVAVKVTNTGTINVATGTLAFTGTGNSFAGTANVSSGATLAISGVSGVVKGTIAGAGTLLFGGGRNYVQTGAGLTTSKLSVSGAGTLAAFSTSVTYEGTFSETTGATVNVNAGVLTLKGAATFSNATVGGSKTLRTYGTTTVAGLKIGGTVTFQNGRTLVQSGGNVTVGDAAGNAAILGNLATGTYKITDDSDIGRGASANSQIVNAGTLSKTGGSATTVITPNVTNTGTITAASGTLDLRGSVGANGKMTIANGATLELDGSVATQAITFASSGGELELINPNAFTGSTLAGFAANDKLDVRGPYAFSGTKVSFLENRAGTQGVLTIQAGANVEKITMLGNYSSRGFHTADDGHHGTLITYTAPGSGRAMPVSAAVSPSLAPSDGLLAASAPASANAVGFGRDVGWHELFAAGGLHAAHHDAARTAVENPDFAHTDLSRAVFEAVFSKAVESATPSHAQEWLAPAFAATEAAFKGHARI